MNTLVAPAQPPELLKMLAHELRWQLVSALAYSDRRVQELVEVVGRPTNLVSYHLRQLREHYLVKEHRSAADARDVYYSLDLEKLRHLYFAAGAALHPTLGQTEERFDAEVGLPPTRILFLCTQNSARSQMAEAITRQMGRGRVEVHSAGTEPSRVNPYAIRCMEGYGIDISSQSSKHLNEYVGGTFDYVITVCDRARESCPVFPGDPERIHWSFRDPAAVKGTEEERLKAFNSTARELTNRIQHLLIFIERKQREHEREARR